MTAPALPAFRQLARACKSPGCPNVVSVADVDGYCVHCHADPTTFKDGSPRPTTEKPCAKCGERPRREGRDVVNGCLTGGPGRLTMIASWQTVDRGSLFKAILATTHNPSTRVPRVRTACTPASLPRQLGSRRAHSAFKAVL